MPSTPRPGDSARTQALAKKLASDTAGFETTLADYSAARLPKAGKGDFCIA